MKSVLSSCRVSALVHNTALLRHRMQYICPLSAVLKPILPNNSVHVSFINGFSITCRGYHSTQCNMLAKKKKSGAKGKSRNDNEDDVGDATLPDVDDVAKQMDARIVRLKDDFTRIHNSRVSKDMFNHVLVDAYGSKCPVPECGQVSVVTASKVVINVFDSAIVPKVSNALRDCGLNLNPVVDGTVLTVPIPKASKEKREELMKVAKKAGEKTKQEIRQIRKVTMDKLKDLKNSFSEDEVRKSTKEVDAATEKKIKAVDNEVKVKEKDILG